MSNLEEHKAGFVSILGNPNVGKSTLMNCLTGEKLSIITSKAQTTRHRIMGIVNGENFQIVYSDTPGILTPNYKMQAYMMKYVEAAIADSDILLYMVDCKETKFEQKIINSVKKLATPCIVVINKIDKADDLLVEKSVQFWQQLLAPQHICCISALYKLNVDDLMSKVVSLLPLSPPYFPKDDLTDRPMRFFVAEMIREKILLQFKKEIPYSVEVVVNQYKEEKDITKIDVTIFTERDSQKAIILGHKGMAIKQLSTDSRIAIEEFIGQKVYLMLNLKVQQNWRNDEKRLHQFGYL
ncbi:MAG: GTPase Era [Bacteroidales bacterium]|nr:GTPase Era [Bacteroidales bacterium]